MAHTPTHEAYIESLQSPPSAADGATPGLEGEADSGGKGGADGGGDEADGGGGDGEADGGGGDGDGDGGGGEGGGDGEADGGGESRSTRVLQSAQSVPKAHELLSLFKPPSSQKPLLAVEHVSMHKVGGDGDGGIMSSSSLVWSSRRCEGIILLFAVSFSCASAPRTPQSEQSEPKAHAFDSAL